MPGALAMVKQLDRHGSNKAYFEKSQLNIAGSVLVRGVSHLDGVINGQDIVSVVELSLFISDRN